MKINTYEKTMFTNHVRSAFDRSAGAVQWIG